MRSSSLSTINRKVNNYSSHKRLRYKNYETLINKQNKAKIKNNIEDNYLLSDNSDSELFCNLSILKSKERLNFEESKISKQFKLDKSKLNSNINKNIVKHNNNNNYNSSSTNDFTVNTNINANNFLLYEEQTNFTNKFYDKQLDNINNYNNNNNILNDNKIKYASKFKNEINNNDEFKDELEYSFLSIIFIIIYQLYTYSIAAFNVYYYILNRKNIVLINDNEVIKNKILTYFIAFCMFIPFSYINIMIFITNIIINKANKYYIDFLNEYFNKKNSIEIKNICIENVFIKYCTYSFNNLSNINNLIYNKTNNIEIDLTILLNSIILNLKLICSRIIYFMYSAMYILLKWFLLLLAFNIISILFSFKIYNTIESNVPSRIEKPLDISFINYDIGVDQFNKTYDNNIYFNNNQVNLKSDIRFSKHILNKLMDLYHVYYNMNTNKKLYLVDNKISISNSEEDCLNFKFNECVVIDKYTDYDIDLVLEIEEYQSNLHNKINVNAVVDIYNKESVESCLLDNMNFTEDNQNNIDNLKLLQVLSDINKLNDFYNLISNCIKIKQDLYSDNKDYEINRSAKYNHINSSDNNYVMFSSKKLINLKQPFIVIDQIMDIIIKLFDLSFSYVGVHKSIQEDVSVIERKNKQMNVLDEFLAINNYNIGSNTNNNNNNNNFKDILLNEEAIINNASSNNKNYFETEFVLFNSKYKFKGIDFGGRKGYYYKKQLNIVNNFVFNNSLDYNLNEIRILLSDKINVKSAFVVFKPKLNTFKLYLNHSVYIICIIGYITSLLALIAMYLLRSRTKTNFK